MLQQNRLSHLKDGRTGLLAVINLFLALQFLLYHFVESFVGYCPVPSNVEFWCRISNQRVVLMDFSHGSLGCSKICQKEMCKCSLLQCFLSLSINTRTNSVSELHTEPVAPTHRAKASFTGSTMLP